MNSTEALVFMKAALFHEKYATIISRATDRVYNNHLRDSDLDIYAKETPVGNSAFVFTIDSREFVVIFSLNEGDELKMKIGSELMNFRFLDTQTIEDCVAILSSELEVCLNRMAERII